MLLDIDNSRQINERFGTATADHVLHEIGAILARHGHAGRLGSDAFAVLAPGDLATAAAIADVTVAQIEEAFEPSSGPKSRRLIGCSAAPQHGIELPELLEAADMALVDAKRAGRSRTAVAGQELATAISSRRSFHPWQTARHAARTTVPVPDGSSLKAEIVLPEGDGPHPGVVILHELFGFNPDIRRIARRFADNGYAAICPDLYSQGSRASCLTAILSAMAKNRYDLRMAPIVAARDALAAHDSVDGERIGIAGFCQGGGFAVVAATNPGFKASAVFYGEVPKEDQAASPAHVR